MAIHLINPASGIINGLSVVCNGRGFQYYENTQRSQHLADATGRFFNTINGRFLSDEWAEDKQVDPYSISSTNTSAYGADALVIVPGSGNQRQAIFGVSYSYDATPVAGRLRIESPSGTALFDETILSSGPGSFDFPKGFVGAESQDVVVRLSGTGAAKKVSLKGTRTQ